jgi:ribulose-phosphate 3-epimerase
MTRIAPSILAADFADLWDQVREVDTVEIIHLDVMDGHFVPNISFGQPVISSLRERTDLYFDTHLMIEQPKRYLSDFSEVGSDRITVHVEAASDLESVVDSIHSLGVDAGVALNPDSHPDSISHLLDDVEAVVVMGVEPGFGGQDFIPSTVSKIETLNEMTDTEIVVDGGINPDTARRCAEAGTDTFVVGSSLFKQRDVPLALERLQDAIE